MDTVFLHGIRTDLVVGVDAWQRENKAQPVVLNLDLVPVVGLEAAAEDDNVGKTLDYGKLYKALMVVLPAQNYSSIHHLFESIQNCLPPTNSSTIEIVLPKAALLADEGIAFTRHTFIAEGTTPAVHQKIELRKLECKCIIGVNAHERLERQRLILNVEAEGLSTPLTSSIAVSLDLDRGHPSTFINATKEVVERVESSSYQTVEALATAVAQILTLNHGFERATVRIDKPSAIASIDAAGVKITRDRSFFENKDFWKVKRT